MSRATSLQVDFGRLGFLVDSETGRRVWLTYRQTTVDVIEGFEAAWRFFAGMFATVIPDNLSAVVDTADPLAHG